MAERQCLNQRAPLSIFFYFSLLLSSLSLFLLCFPFPLSFIFFFLLSPVFCPFSFSFRALQPVTKVTVKRKHDIKRTVNSRFRRRTVIQRGERSSFISGYGAWIRNPAKQRRVSAIWSRNPRPGRGAPQATPLPSHGRRKPVAVGEWNFTWRSKSKAEIRNLG